MIRLAAVGVALLLTGGALESPVADAAQHGDTEMVRSLLREGADVNAAQGDGMSALHWAAVNDAQEMIGVLLYAGANTEATTRLGGYTPVHLASREGNAAALDALLSGGADAGAVTTTGIGPLHYAAASGHAAAVDALVRHGAAVDARTVADDQTPLMWATAANRLETMAALLEAGADPSLTSAVTDYVAIAAEAMPERRLRAQLANVRRNAERGSNEQARDTRGPQGQLLAPTEEEPDDEEGEGEESEDEGDEEEAGEAEAEEAPPESETAEETPDEESAGSEEGAGSEAEDDPEEGGEAEGADEGGEDEPEDDFDSEPEPESEDEGESDDDDESEAEEEERPLGYNDLVGKEGGFAALHFAARDGRVQASRLLIQHGAELDQPTAGDATTPLLMATINGNFDLAMEFLALGADPNTVAEDGAAPLFTVLNRRWGPKAAYPQPSAFTQQETDYLEFLTALIDAGADVNHRTGRHIWYTSFNFDMLGVNFAGATAFWRAAYATDLEAMRLLVSAGADPSITTRKVPSRRFGRRGNDEDESGLDPVPTGGPAVHPIHAASGVGYGEGFAANSHSHAPDSWLASVKYLVEEHGADVNARDLNGYAPLHHAAARGDNELIEYLVSQGADVMVVSRRGETTVDMANGPRQRVQPFPETIALLESLGAVNNHNCQSCE
ncbi:MAG: ankyrin repeat domain-containing protein [Gemmatimonadota bacterium]